MGYATIEKEIRTSTQRKIKTTKGNICKVPSAINVVNKALHNKAML